VKVVNSSLTYLISTIPVGTEDEPEDVVEEADVEADVVGMQEYTPTRDPSGISCTTELFEEQMRGRSHKQRLRAT